MPFAPLHCIVYFIQASVIFCITIVMKVGSFSTDTILSSHLVQFCQFSQGLKEGLSATSFFPVVYFLALTGFIVSPLCSPLRFNSSRDFAVEN